MQLGVDFELQQCAVWNQLYDVTLDPLFHSGYCPHQYSRR